MLSRLSGLANTVLQELSGDGEDAGTGILPAGPDVEPGQQNGEETPEDLLERLAHMERLVAQLKDVVREKDAALQEERQAADTRLAKLKLQAKAKVASLNKRIEDLMGQGAKDQLLGGQHPPSKLQLDQGRCGEEAAQIQELQRQLREQEEVVRELQEQLAGSTASVKEAKAQLSSLQETLREKDCRLEEQTRQHQAELQQNLRLLQRKLEEQEAALLGRTQVVELLQQELNGAEEQQQILSEKLQKTEAELDSMKSTSACERQEAQSLVERLELELAEQKLAFHRLQEEVQQLSEDLAHARAVRAERESVAVEERHGPEVAEKSLQLTELQRAEQDLRATDGALLAERGPRVDHSPGDMPALQGVLPESVGAGAEPLSLPAGQVSTPSEAVLEQEAAAPSGRKDRQQAVERQEALEAENETLHSELALLQKRLELTTLESSQVSSTEMQVNDQPLLDSGAPSDFSNSSVPGGPLDGLRNGSGEGPPAPDAPLPLTQDSPEGSPKEPPLLLPCVESDQSDILEFLSAKKCKDLSVLLLELQEAQQEIALLKGQLGDSSSGLGPERAEQLSEMLQAGGAEGRGAESPPRQSPEEHCSLLSGTLLEQDGGPLAETGNVAPEPSPALASRPQELPRLQLEMAELQASQRGILEGQATQIRQLQQQVEDSGGTVRALTMERDELCSQLKALSSTEELKEQVRQLESDLAESEKQRIFEYESGLSQVGPLKEQIRSMRHEARSKEVKIEALQKDLDESLRHLAEQEVLGRRLTSQLWTEEQETLALVGRLQETSAKVEELSRSSLSRDLELSRLEMLLSEGSLEIERLQKEVTEREQRMAEARVGHLNETFALEKELKHLQEQLSFLGRERETREQGVGPEEAEKVSPASEEVEKLREENEQVRKKLQAALISRKQLQAKVCKLEKQLGGGGGGPLGKAVAEAVEPRDKAGGEESLESNVAAASDGTSSLSSLLSAKEAELQAVLGEKESTTAAWQAVIGQLQEKDLLVDALQAELEDQRSAHKEEAPADPRLNPSKQSTVLDSSPEPGFAERQRRDLEEELSALEQEREQLQKEVQDTIQKALEKEHHHREQLKQQKEEYNLLQEQFDKQSREKERIQDQLRQLQAQSEKLESLASPAAAEVAADRRTQPALGPAQLGKSWAPRSLPAPQDQFQTVLENLQAEKAEQEAQIGRLEGLLVSKSEAALVFQEQVGQLLAQMEAMKAARCPVEASLATLQLELEASRAEIASQEGLRLQQVALEEKEVLSKEDIQGLRVQLADRNEVLSSLQAELQGREDTIQALRGQLETQSKEHVQSLQAERAELQQKLLEGAGEDQTRGQLQRKLQAALISRKEALKESKSLREQLDRASLRLTDAENRASVLATEKEALLGKLAVLQGEREKLIAEVDKSLVENQSLLNSCESLKLALEGLTQEKARLEAKVGALQHSGAEALSEWQGKRQEQQQEYETLLQSYENVSDEAERIRRVVETVRQEKQDLFLKLKGAEAEKREVDAELHRAEQEMEAMREKMRKFAKSKQQKILELEEENERLRAEGHPVERDLGGKTEELERSKKTCESLSGQLERLTVAKESLHQEAQDLKRELQSPMEPSGTGGLQEDAASEVLNCTMAVPLEAAASQARPSGGTAPAAVNLNTEEEEEKASSKSGPSSDEINQYIQQVSELTRRTSELEDARRVSAEELSRSLAEVEALRKENERLESLLATKDWELGALQEKVATVERACQQGEEQLARATKLKESLEAEKDDLEERLMNQLAELNGSIGNYQQEMADAEGKNQQLLREVEDLRGALSQLEEEKRHLARERVEKKEYVDKLQKGAWKGDGGWVQARELQELLKEKQQEVKQLQKGCIQSQEKISSLERTIKALEFVQSESQRELEATRKHMTKAGDDTKQAQAELAACRVLLDDTQSEAARVLAESLKAKESLQASQEKVTRQLRQKEAALERRLEQEKGRHVQEVRAVEEKLEALQREQERSERVAQDLRDSLVRKDQEAKQLQGSLNQTLAQLAAFSRSMSALQDDRDRVIDESRQWEKKFSEALEKKEGEVCVWEKRWATLEDQAKQAAVQVQDLQSRIASLELSKSALEFSSQKELLHHQKETESLQEETQRLASQLQESQQLLGDFRNQVQKRETDLRSLRVQLSDLEASLAKSKEAQETAEDTVKRRDADLQECRFLCEQLEANLQASKDLTDHLHEEIGRKDQKIMGLLAAKEEAIAVALSEAQQRHEEVLKELKGRVAKGEEERAALGAERRRAVEKVDHLVARLKSTQEESKQQNAQLASFTKSMSSLQDDRDRVLGDNQQLEKRHLAAILEKDHLIQEAAAENNKLKEELRSLHGRMDDLHAENAKLDAELVRYREDLQQLLSIKDCQQKQLLKTQLERIQALEKEKAGVAARLREAECRVEALKQEAQNTVQERVAAEASLSRLQEEMAALHEGGPILELQTRLQGAVEEAQELSGQLMRAQQRVAELEEELSVARKTAAEQMHEAETKMKKELKSLHHDAGLMRNETETAEERVAELAKDLLEMEQNLLSLTEENQDLKAQLQSFGKAMSSLQGSWDQSNAQLRALEKKYSTDVEEQRLLVQGLQEEQKTLVWERDALTSELAALQLAVEERGLFAQLEKLNQQLQAKDLELLSLTAELEGASGQLKSFSQAMASLQGERDRLLGEVEKARTVDEAKLKSSASGAEVQSLKKALSSLQDDRDRLLAELKNLGQQFLHVSPDVAEVTRLRAQLEEQAEELRQEKASWQLGARRAEKAASERAAPSEQHSMARAKKEHQPSHVPRAALETRPSVEEQHQRQAAPPEASGSRKAWKGDGSSPEGNHLQTQLQSSLKELHQKELRIQQLNSKLSQVFEEKNALSLQLRGSSRHLRESQQCYSDLFSRCEALEKQLQELQPPMKNGGTLSTDAAPGAPQERSETPKESYTPELQELQSKLSEAKLQHDGAQQGLLHLEGLLREEQDRRLAAEEALSAAQDHIRSLESSDWEPSWTTSIAMPPATEHARLVGGPMDGSFSKPRGGTGLRRVLCSLFCSRRRLPLLATVYLLVIHALLLLCFTGHL